MQAAVDTGPNPLIRADPFALLQKQNRAVLHQQKCFHTSDFHGTLLDRFEKIKLRIFPKILLLIGMITLFQ
jgi:hypothetical protein